MSQSTRGAKPGLIALASGTVLFVLVAWFVHTYERVAYRVDLPPAGEAAWNPLYVLKQALRADGVSVDARPRFDLEIAQLGRRDTLVLLDDPRYLDAARASALLDWVARGGHLVVRTPPGPAFGLHESMPLLEALRLTPMAVGDCAPFQVRGQPPHVEFCGARRFSFQGAQPVLAWGNLRDGYVYARLARGQGYVDVLADVDFLQNGGPARRGDDGSGLRAPTHQALARQVLAPNYGHGTMHLVYATRMPSLWRTVLERGWPVWSLGVLALAPLLLMAFWQHQKGRERSGASPLVSPAALSSRALRRTLLATLFFYALAAFFLIFAVYQQAGLHHGPLAAGIAILPVGLGLLLGALSGPRVARRLHARTAAFAMSLEAAGLTVAAVLAACAAPAWLPLPLALIGIGQGIAHPALVRLNVDQVEAQWAGLAAGVVSAVLQISAALSVALVGGVFFSMVPDGAGANVVAHGFAFASLLIAASLAIAAALSWPRQHRAAKSARVVREGP